MRRLLVRRLLGRLALLLLLAGMGTFAYLEWTRPPAEQAARRAGGRRGGGGGPGGEGPVPVYAVAARAADVPVTLDAVGTVQALNTVTVRSQVDGRLLELAFREGQDVKAGEVLARIEPTIYQAQYDQAQAKKAQDEANLANARLDLQRYVNLAQTNYGSKQQADTQRAAVAQLEAQLRSDQGAIDNAAAYLEWTTIRAPIGGRTGLRLVDQGNLVRAADTTGLVTITQLQPISLVFNLAQQNLRPLTAALARGAVAVDALESDNRTPLDRGTIAVVDNLVDQTTGTVKVKATFPNDRLQLWPGAFVNVRVTVDTLRGVVVVPTGAVQRGPNGAFVFALDGDAAKMRPVAVTRQDEEIAVIGSGVTPPERVITTGFVRLTDGQQVRVAEPEPSPGATPATPAAAPTPEARRTVDGRPVEGRQDGGPGRRRRPEGQAASGEGERPGGGERRRRPQGQEAGAPPAAAGAGGPATTGTP